jgi:hypothetical protein
MNTPLFNEYFRSGSFQNQLDEKMSKNKKEKQPDVTTRLNFRARPKKAKLKRENALRVSFEQCCDSEKLNYTLLTFRS